MNIAPEIIRHYRCRLIGIMVSLAMAWPVSEARDMPIFNQRESPIASASNTVRCIDGLLSVNAQDIGLAELLDEVASQCDLTVVWVVALEQRLSVEFYRLTLAQGLQRILRSRSYVLLSTPPTPGKRPATAARAGTLWILPQANEMYSTQSSVPTTQSANRVSADASAPDVSRLASALSNGSLDDRAQAAVALGKRGHARAVVPLSHALADRNAEVREAAIDSLAEIGGADATRALAVALRDRDPHIREQAVDALGQAGGTIATGLLQQALTDEVAFVRQAATEILEQLRSAAR